MPNEPSHPVNVLLSKAKLSGSDVDSLKFASQMDKDDSIHHLRNEFCFPKCGSLPKVDLDLVNADDECLYLCGNSLGLMAKKSRERVIRNLEQWSALGVEGYFYGERPFTVGDREVTSMMTKIVGAERDEVVLMNALTVNQHFMLTSFYQPTEQRHKILLEDGAFPSDYYAVDSQIRLRGFDPKTSMILIKAREGEYTLRTDDILKVIKEEGDSIAVIMLPGVQYRTGQVLDMKAIADAGHKKGCIVGFDLAHAVGNIELFLHDWNVDFAIWCTYKYLCAGAGGIGGAFVHRKYHTKDQFKLQGWWSHKADSRFQMNNVMEEEEGAAAFRISNPPNLMCAALEGALEVYQMTTMQDLRAKSIALTSYLELLINQRFSEDVQVITPSDVKARGSQLSIVIKKLKMEDIFSALCKRGVLIDDRRPNIIRVTPVPIYNSFADVYRFVNIFDEVLQAVKSH